MNSFGQLSLIIGAAVCLLPIATANTITFDEYPATNSDNFPYGMTIMGATFSPTNAGTWDGLGYGDPGNWQISGDNGPQFLGFNGYNNPTGDTPPYVETVTFASPVADFFADFSRGPYTPPDLAITLSAFDGAALLATTTETLGAINNWQTLGFDISGITKIVWSGMGTGEYGDHSVYGVDNVNFTPVPEPVGIAPMAIGFAVIAVHALRFANWRAKR